MNKEIMNLMTQRYLEATIHAGQVRSLVHFYFNNGEEIELGVAPIYHSNEAEKQASLEEIRQYARQTSPVAVQIYLDTWATQVDENGESRRIDAIVALSELANGERWIKIAELKRDENYEVIDASIKQAPSGEMISGWEIFKEPVVQ